MAWIESHQTLSRHRKTLRAAALLHVDRHKMIGHLHELWWWALDNVPPDGALDGLSDDEIAEGAGWSKGRAQFVRALTEAGFIDQDQERRRLHDWYDYAGKLMERRASERERLRRARAKSPSSSAHPSSLEEGPAVRSTVRRTNAQPSQVTVPNRTVPNRTNVPELDYVLRSPEDDEARAPAPANVPEPLKRFDEILRGLRGYQPTAEFYDVVQRDFGQLPLDQEAIKALEHAKKKHYAGDLKFVLDWLARAEAGPPWEPTSGKEQRRGATRKEPAPTSATPRSGLAKWSQ